MAKRVFMGGTFRVNDVEGWHSNQCRSSCEARNASVDMPRKKATCFGCGAGMSQGDKALSGQATV